MKCDISLDNASWFKGDNSAIQVFVLLLVKYNVLCYIEVKKGNAFLESEISHTI